MAKLDGKKIAILVTNGFEQVEMTDPRTALEEAGAATDLIAPKREDVRGWKFTEWGDSFPADESLDVATPDQYDGLLLPGGVMSPDKLRADGRAVSFVRGFFDAGKPVAAICHGPWTIIEADRANGRRMTSYHSIRTDLINAGAHWIDKEMVRDGNLVTSRSPDDLPRFKEAIVDLFAGE